MDEYVTKPLDSRRLCAVVERVAGGGSGSGAEESAAAALAAGSTVSYDSVLARVGGDAQLLAEISRLFVDDVPAHLERIRAALDARDGDALRRAAHALKGAAANFDATAVVGAARALEEIGRTSDFAASEDVWRTLSIATAALVSVVRQFAQSVRASAR
jgi:HPt (histidine-containing phosphotransfer) domain-containing protein